MEYIAAIIGHLAWPVAALLGFWWLLRELKGGLLVQLLPHGGRVKAPGVDIEINAAKNALEASGADVPQLSAEVSSVIEDATPYETVISSWREVANQIAQLASKHGGELDARKLYKNVDLLEQKGVLSSHFADAARSLFRARNSMRRLPPEDVSQETAEDFAESAQSLSFLIGLIG